MTKVYQAIAQALQAHQACVISGNGTWEERHKDRILTLVRDYMPAGAGVDNGTHLNFEASTPEKLVFDVGFHHMSDGGYYTGWTQHKIIITPSLAHGFDIKVTGRDKNGIKEYLADTYHSALEGEAQ